MNNKRLLELAGVSLDSKYAKTLLSESTDDNTLEEEFGTYVVEMINLETEFDKLVPELADVDDENDPKLDEAVERINPEGVIGAGAVALLSELIKRMEAAKRGLGITNKLSPEKKASHRKVVMGNMNKIRADLKKVQTMM